MRKNNTAIIFGSLFFSCSVMAANGTLAPTVVPMVNGGQASIAISNTSPNLFTVPGDRIIAVNSLDGALTNNEQTASGGVVVATVNKKPFTFILETERGLNLSIQAVPREGAGRTIQLVSDLRGTGEEAGAWETSTPYEPDLPDGRTEQAVREIAGQERDRADITEREAALPESVLRESQREQEAVREVARENLLQERLQQMERDMVRDLQKEKTLGGD